MPENKPPGASILPPLHPTGQIRLQRLNEQMVVISHQHQDIGEALRHDDAYSYVAAWEYTGNLAEPKLQKEWLKYQSVDFVTRSYK